MWNQGRKYNRGAMIAGNMAGRDSPIMNKGASMADTLYAYKDGKDWNAQSQKNEALKAAGAAYGSGDKEGWRKNMAIADPNRLVDYDVDQQKMESADAARREQMAQMLRMHNDEMNYKNSMTDLQRQQIASKLQSKMSPYEEIFQKEKAKNAAEAEKAVIDLEAGMPKIYEDVNKLSKLSENATYSGFGRGVDSIFRFLGSDTDGGVARAEMLNIVENNVLPQLRSMLGAQFTEREGEKVKQTIMDPNLSPREKQVQLKSFLSSKEDAVRQNREKARRLGVFMQNQKNVSENKPLQIGGFMVEEIE